MTNAFLEGEVARRPIPCGIHPITNACDWIWVLIWLIQLERREYL